MNIYKMVLNNVQRAFVHFCYQMFSHWIISATPVGYQLTHHTVNSSHHDEFTVWK